MTAFVEASGCFAEAMDREVVVQGVDAGIAPTRRVVHPVNAMDRPVQVTLDPERRRRARRRAAEQGLTLSDYIAGLVEADLEAWTPKPGAPAIIPIGIDLPTDHEGTYIGEAVAARMNKPAEPET